MLAPVRRSADRSPSCPFSRLSAEDAAPDPPGFFCTPDGNGGAIVPRGRERRRADAERAHRWLLERVEPDRHPCVAARSAFNSDSYRFGLYPALASDAATAGVAADLERFALGVGEPDGAAAADASDFATFIAVFDAPLPAAADESREETFERLLWAQLQALHEADERSWDPATSPNPSHKDFSFSFAGRSFYIIGMHPDASRPARRFPRPALVFNLHAQFERLRATGSYEKMRDLIRERDTQQTGGMNPMLADFGQRSEAVQYSGRAVDGPWK
ncbi:guanitoxin biosynthesis heme-dependent pre-guanitoxin N-hydroxylase GntA, partial [Alienimonas sp. DA493]|uniref:guanitoxin biosynthesis heme-dependent pre-guanitoxin N-hydroxylase GntA n=1 Tax=Alienimonas sp. DA493 TaxID=3373605 RepID=UPI0037550839